MPMKMLPDFLDAVFVLATGVLASTGRVSRYPNQTRCDWPVGRSRLSLPRDPQKENKMRMLVVGAALAMMTSAAMADDDDAKGAQKLAMQGRDDYWHCLAREYSRDRNQGLSEQEFGRSVAGACPSERQY